MERVLSLTDISLDKVKRICINSSGDEDCDFAIEGDDDWPKFDEYLEKLIQTSRHGHYKLYLDIDDEVTLNRIKAISDNFHIGLYLNYIALY